MSIDFQNAFNTIDRSAFLAACRDHCPQVAAWAHWCYEEPSELLFNDVVIDSSAGVQQGDALGPLLFALALHLILKQVRTIRGLDIVVGYLDDVLITGDEAAVLEAWERICEAAPRIGLILNFEKCELIPTAASASACDLSQYPAQVKRNTTGNFKLLGAPVGSQEFSAKFIREKRASKAKEMLAEVPLLEDGQIAHKILMRCMGASRLMYNMRTTRSDWIGEELAAGDAALREAFEAATGLALSDSQWSQATLSLKTGGLGLRSAQLHGPASYLDSRTASRKLCKDIGSAYRWDLSEDGLQQARESYNRAMELPYRLNDESFHEDASPIPQRALSSRLDTCLSEMLRQQAPTVDRARLFAVSAPHACAWLQALPSEAVDQRMSHTDFLAALQLWLGVSVQPTDTWCPKCDQILDSRAFHCLACMAGGDAVALHNLLRDHIFNTARAAGFNPEREEPGLLPDAPQRRPGDLYFPTWPGGSRVAMDFAVTSPLQSSAVTAAAQRHLAAAALYEEHKLTDRDTARSCAEQGIRLIPMIAESFGGWGEAAQKAFSVIAGAKAARTGLDISITTSQLYEGLSIKIMRANARALLARVAQDEIGSGAHKRAHAALMATLA